MVIASPQSSWPLRGRRDGGKMIGGAARRRRRFLGTSTSQNKRSASLSLLPDFFCARVRSKLTFFPMLEG